VAFRDSALEANPVGRRGGDLRANLDARRHPHLHDCLLAHGRRDFDLQLRTWLEARWDLERECEPLVTGCLQRLPSDCTLRYLP